MNKLKQEYMHVPLYAWLAGGAALILSVLYFMRHRGTAAAVSSVPVSAGANGYPQNVYADSTTYNNSTTTNTTTPGSTQTTPPPTTPIAPVGGSTIPTPPTAPAAPTRIISVIVQRWPNQLGSLSGIAAWVNAHYGTHITWQQIYAQNRGIIGGNPNLIHPGQNLSINLQGGGGAGESGSAMLPQPFSPSAWQPQMNSQIFGSQGTSPVAPSIVWNMTPTAAYTQV